MQMLLLSDSTRARLEELRLFAEKNPYTMDDLLDIKNGDALPPGDVDGYWCNIPVGIKVVFTIELQRFKIRHLSMSAQGKLPPLPFAIEVMELLGMDTPITDCFVSTEHDNRVINIIDIVK